MLEWRYLPHDRYAPANSLTLRGRPGRFDFCATASALSTIVGSAIKD